MNRKEIYEGDICKIVGVKNNAVVVWDDEYTLFEFSSDNSCPAAFKKSLNEIYVEVIGNIFDNPELLKGEDCNENQH